MLTFIEAAQAAYDKHLSRPYSANTLLNRWKIQTSLKTPSGTVYRPNHGLAQTLRVCHYIPTILEFYKENGLRNPDGTPSIAFNEITEDDIARLQQAMLFYVSGRQDETSFRASKDRYFSYRKCSGQNFYNFYHENNYYGADKLFTSEQQLKNYQEKIELGFSGIKSFEPGGKREGQWGSKEHVLFMMMATAHELDLSRCSTPARLKKALFGNTLGRYTQHPDNRDAHSLVAHAQECALATGDQLKTYYDYSVTISPHFDGSVEKMIRPFVGELKPRSRKNRDWNNPRSFVYAKHHNKKKFGENSTNVEHCVKTLEGVPRPIFLSRTMESVTAGKDMQALIDEALNVISSGNGAIRLFSGQAHNQSMRFDFEQLADPSRFRPVHFSKMKLVSDEKRRHVKNLFHPNDDSVFRPYHENKDVLGHTHGVKYEDYYDEEGARIPHPISKPSVRGQIKETPFTKKASYSLLSTKGQVKHFFAATWMDAIRQYSGRTFKVGFLSDITEMHLKGESYMFRGDVFSTNDRNGFFWIGKKPNNNKLKTKISEIETKILCPERNRPQRLAELKEYLALKDKPLPWNEMIIGNQKSALRALFTKQKSRLTFLQLVDTAVRLRADYGLVLPLFLINGKHAPRVIGQDELISKMQRYHKWFFRGHPIIRFFKWLFAMPSYYATKRMMKSLQVDPYAKDASAQIREKIIDKLYTLPLVRNPRGPSFSQPVEETDDLLGDVSHNNVPTIHRPCSEILSYTSQQLQHTNNSQVPTHQTQKRILSVSQLQGPTRGI